MERALQRFIHTRKICLSARSKCCKIAQKEEQLSRKRKIHLKKMVENKRQKRFENHKNIKEET